MHDYSKTTAGDSEPADEAGTAGRVPSRTALPPFSSLRAFDAVARLGGIRRAARELELSHAVVSRHVRSLEVWLGRTLLDRNRGGTTLSREGKAYHKRVAASIDEIAQATIDLMRNGDDNRLRVWCMPGFALQWLTHRLNDFQSGNSGLDIQLRPSDVGPDFSHQQADVDIRYVAIYGPEPVYHASVRIVEVARPPVIPVASPDYVARIGPLQTAADLLHQSLIHEESVDNWRTWLAHQGVPMDGVTLHGPRLWHGHLTVDAARRSVGIALANHFLASDDLAAGRLIELKGVSQPFDRVALGAYVFVSRADRWNSEPVAKCREWLTRLIAEEFDGHELDLPSGRGASEVPPA